MVALLNRKFLLTRPLRDVTTAAQVSELLALISTHTPLAGRDGIYGIRWREEA